MQLYAPRRRCPRSGAAIVELTILLPFLIFAFLVGIDWCRIFYVAHTLDNSARNGAIAASGIANQERDLTDSQRQALGKAEAIKDGTSLNPPLAESDVQVTTSGGVVTVTVTYDFAMLSKLPGLEGVWKLSRTVQIPVHP